MKQTKIKSLLAPTVESLGYELWACQYIPQGKHSLLRVYIDKSTGIQLEDCERVSRQLSALLDVEDLITGNYNLEVSSPGLDRPLMEAAHFERFIGAMVKLRLSVPIDGKKKYVGVITGIESGVLTLNVDDNEIVVSLDDINKANLVEVLSGESPRGANNG